MKKKIPICKNHACKKPLFKTIDKYCSYSCAKTCDDITKGFKQSQKPIKKVSDKRKIENYQYGKMKKDFMSLPENKYCPIAKEVFGIQLESTEIHHTFCGKDRAKYFLDKSTWIAVSRKGHNYIHNNVKESYQKDWLKH